MKLEEIGSKDIDWFDLAQVSFQWRTDMNTVINVPFLKRWQIF
jgi:hypothetical protein